MQREFYLFNVGPVPVSASIWFFLLVAFMVSGNDLLLGAVWACVVTLSILVHELGHATMATRYRLNPRVVLHGMGGLCAHDRAETDAQDAKIIAAGPGAGLMLGLGTVAVWWALSAFAPALLEQRPMLATILGMSVFVNIFWSFVNLLPLFPLDGGQLFRLGMLRVFASPVTAEKVTHAVGVAVGVGGLVAAVYFQAAFVGIIALFLVAANVQGFQAQSASGPIRVQPGHDRAKAGTLRTLPTHARQLLVESEAALAAGNGREAARLGYQVRSLGQTTNAQADAARELIALGELQAGRVDEGLSAAKYATPTPRLAAACAKALLQSDRAREAEAWMAMPAFSKLPQSERDEIAAIRG